MPHELSTMAAARRAPHAPGPPDVTKAALFDATVRSLRSTIDDATFMRFDLRAKPSTGGFSPKADTERAEAHARVRWGTGTATGQGHRSTERADPSTVDTGTADTSSTASTDDVDCGLDTRDMDDSDGELAQWYTQFRRQTKISSPAAVLLCGVCMYTRKMRARQPGATAVRAHVECMDVLFRHYRNNTNAEDIKTDELWLPGCHMFAAGLCVAMLVSDNDSVARMFRTGAVSRPRNREVVAGALTDVLECVLGTTEKSWNTALAMAGLAMFLAGKNKVAERLADSTGNAVAAGAVVSVSHSAASSDAAPSSTNTAEVARLWFDGRGCVRLPMLEPNYAVSFY